MNLIPPYVIFAAIGVAFLLGLAGAITLARSIRRRLRVAAAIVSAADVERRRSRFKTELERHGIDTAEQPPATGHASRAVVDLAAERAAYADQLGRADTQQIAPVHTARHAAKEREQALDELHAGGWTRDRLQANATEGRW